MFKLKQSELTFKSAIFTSLVLVIVAIFSIDAVNAKDGEGFRDPINMEVFARPITSFKIGAPERKRFGALEFLGGLEMVSPNKHFGALSGVSLVPEKNLLFAVADTGFWLVAQMDKEQNGKINGLKNARMVAIRDKDGNPVVGKDNGDCESVQVVGDTAWLSFERKNRVEFAEITSGDIENDLPLASTHRYGPDYRKKDLRGNKGLETIAIDVAHGTKITISERSLNKKGNIRAFLIDTPEPKEFSITQSDEFDITDAAFLPNGDLIILERRFNMSSGVHMRLRRLPRRELKQGNTVTGIVLMQADMSYQIDNMEGLDIHQNSKGESILTMVSDDNHSLLQRNLLLQFKLMDGDFLELPELRPSISDQ